MSDNHQGKACTCFENDADDNQGFQGGLGAKEAVVEGEDGELGKG